MRECGGGADAPTAPCSSRRDTVESAEEIMNLLEAFDLTGSMRDAGELSGVSHHTGAKYMAAAKRAPCRIGPRRGRS